MVNLRFQKWCRDAVSRIVLIPDRITVGQELYDHLEDQYQSHLERGCTPQEAENAAVSSMGDPAKLAPELAAIHRPFWGRVLLVSQRILRVLLPVLALVFAAWLLLHYLLRPFELPEFKRYNPYTDTAVSDSAGKMTRSFYISPDSSATTDGYTLTVTDAALWHSTYTDINGKPAEDDRFHFRVTVSNPLPWAEYTDILRWFWAEDSLGNYYYSAYESGSSGDPSIRGAVYQSAPITCIYEMELTNFVSQDAQWIDLHYDRAGRNVLLRIDLTGGSQ